MKSRLLHQDEERTFAIVLDSGDRVKDRLMSFARENNILGAHFTGIGAFDDVTLGYFDWNSKTYREIPVHGQVEVLNLTGDIAVWQGAPSIHAHVVIGDSDGAAHGGHLMDARVRPTLEIIVVEVPAHLRREIDRESRLPLLRVDSD